MRHTLPGVRLPPNVYATGNLADALDAELALDCHALESRSGSGGPARHIEPGSENAVFVSCTKGIEHDTGKLMSQILEECLPANRVAVLSGPNHAVEVAQRIPAAGVIGSTHAELLDPLQKTFSLPTFRAYTSDDVTGIQLGWRTQECFRHQRGCLGRL